MEKPALKVEDISIRFNLSNEKVDNLKELLIKKIKGETIRFNEFWALKNINFELQKVDRLGILGLNGAGKSTLLKVIAGVYKPTTGKVTRNGHIAPMIELGAGFDPNYTGRENIFLYGSVLGFSRSFLEEKDVYKRQVLHGFYLSMEDDLPGPMLLTNDEVVDAIKNIDQIQEKYKDRYEEFYNRFCCIDDGHATERVVNKIFKES